MIFYKLPDNQQKKPELQSCFKKKTNKNNVDKIKFKDQKLAEI